MCDAARLRKRLTISPGAITSYVFHFFFFRAGGIDEIDYLGHILCTFIGEIRPNHNSRKLKLHDLSEIIVGLLLFFNVT